MSKIKLNKNQILLLNIAIILIVTLTPGNGKIAGNYLDKIVHYSIFLALGFNISRKFGVQGNLIDGLLWAIVFGLTTEIVQQVILGRNMEFYDGLADTLGVVSGFYFYKRYYEPNLTKKRDLTSIIYRNKN